jgi:hypothetical protein
MADATSPATTTDPTQSVGGLGSALYALYQTLSGNTTQNANNVANIANPFEGQYTQYDKPLQQLITNPSSFTESPAAVAATQLGSQAAERAANAQGAPRSGTEVANVDQLATQYASQDYNQQVQNLMTLTGANNMYGPMAAAQAVQTGQNNSAAGVGAGGTALNSILSMLGLGTGGAGSLSGAGSSILSTIQNLFGGGGGGIDTSNLGGVSGANGGIGGGTAASDFGGTTPASTAATTDISNTLGYNDGTLNPDDIDWTSVFGGGP